jgi:hypothetical protein
MSDKQNDKVEVICGHEVHRLASLWPMVEGGESLTALQESIRAIGVLHEIVRDKATGKIVDGRNRLRVYDEVAKDLGKEWADKHPLRFVDREFADENEIWEHVKAFNKARRHMTDDQLVAVAVLAGQYLERTKEAKAKTQFKKGGKKAAPDAVVVAVEGPDGTPILTGAPKPAVRKTSTEYLATTAGGLIATDAGVGIHKGRQGAVVAKGIAKGAISRADLQKVADGAARLKDVADKVEVTLNPAKADKPKKVRVTLPIGGLPEPLKIVHAKAMALEAILSWMEKTATTDELYQIEMKLKELI